MPPPPGRESAGRLRTALKHSLILGLFGVFGYVIYGSEAPGKLLLAFVATFSGLAFLRIFGRVEKK
ncbi:hypothetical protein SAMN05443254_101703 [Bradyrhizobium sp. OK095]|jgi:hypothetical protein|nr:hypothetical protein SAMN05443254_101703 [Bradyrhizobium sp. OK095]